MSLSAEPIESKILADARNGASMAVPAAIVDAPELRRPAPHARSLADAASSPFIIALSLVNSSIKAPPAFTSLAAGIRL
jgi:hypothetical protein